MSLAAFGLAIIPFGPTAQAQDVSQNPSSGLQISPTRTELTIQPGKADVVNLNIKNITTGNVVARVEVDDFRADNDTGAPQILVNNRETLATSIKSFLSGVTDIPLKVNETKRIQIFVSLPKSQTAGAYYGVVRYQAIPEEKVKEIPQGQQVSLTASVGHIVLVSVPGDITEKMELLGVHAERDQKYGNFFVYPPQKIAVDVKNLGNSFLKPFGNVTVKDWRGKQVASYEINNTDPRGNVLPASIRTFRDDIKDIGSIGRYSVVASISYGNGGEVLNVKSSFWVVPYWLIGIILALILFLTIMILLMTRKLKKRKKFGRRH